MKRTTIVLLTCLSLTAFAQSDDKLKPAKCGNIRRLHVQNDVYLGSQPSKEDFAALKDKGIKTVINLRTARELAFDAKEAAKKNGLEYHHLPFLSPESLTDDLLDNARKLLKDKKKKPILLHCASANRVGAVWLAHRVLDDKIDFETALKEAQTIGLRTTAYVQKVKVYVKKKD